jgi:hypothetical protein
LPSDRKSRTFFKRWTPGPIFAVHRIRKGETGRYSGSFWQGTMHRGTRVTGGHGACGFLCRGSHFTGILNETLIHHHRIPL